MYAYIYIHIHICNIHTHSQCYMLDMWVLEGGGMEFHRRTDFLNFWMSFEKDSYLCRPVLEKNLENSRAYESLPPHKHKAMPEIDSIFAQAMFVAVYCSMLL